MVSLNGDAFCNRLTIMVPTKYPEGRETNKGTFLKLSACDQQAPRDLATTTTCPAEALREGGSVVVNFAEFMIMNSLAVLSPGSIRRIFNHRFHR